MRPSPALRTVGGWLGILGPVVYVGTWAVLGALREGYDPVRQAISELGEVGAATQPAMSGAFIAFGLAALPFALALRRTLPGNARPVAVAAAICGLATFGAAFLPCTATCPGPGTTFTDTGHSVVAIVGYLALMATPLLAGRLLLAHGPRWRTFALWSLAAGGLGSAMMLAWALGWFGAAGGAGQRAFNTLADVWWATAGLVILRSYPRLKAPHSG
jgi:hypothetical protein